MVVGEDGLLYPEGGREGHKGLMVRNGRTSEFAVDGIIL